MPDNCEHVINAAARLVDALVRMCPDTSFLATSGEALRIEGEYAHAAPALAVPFPHQDEPSTIRAHSTVQLFISRTARL